ncbi:MAG TPA: hypothetical protein VLE51_02365 [Candidatus Saccharimonadales bacterium]|nr:hypothetical protein [Candidatus Saccharimonadales bacterium]
MISQDGLRQLNRLQERFPSVAKKFEGTAILAPTAMELANSIGLHNSKLYKGGTGRLAWTLKALTGLDEIHRGFVLGNPENVTELTQEDLRPIREHVDIEELAETISTLPEADRLRLLGKFTVGQS